jgi:hypothetical protein
MKKINFLLSFLMSGLYAALFGAALSLAVPVDPAMGALVFFAARTIYLFILKGEHSAGFTLSGVNQEIWIEALKENFYSNYPWLDGVVDWSEWVENNTINFAAVGTNPVILKNNSSWPIVAAQRTDTALTVVLDTYDSTTSRVRNVEAIEAAYNKLQSVVKQHKQSLLQEMSTEAIWNYGPATAAAGAVAVTGANRGVVIGAQSSVAATMQLDDILGVKERWDALEFPADGRVLVLSPYHERDLRKQDSALFKSFTNEKKGTSGGYLGSIYGFDMYTVGNVPLYTKSTLAKKAYGAGADNTNDCVASVAFNQNEVMKALGDMEMFHREMATNPEHRADEVGFQIRAKVVPQRTTNFYQQALVSNRA